MFHSGHVRSEGGAGAQRLRVIQSSKLLFHSVQIDFLAVQCGKEVSAVSLFSTPREYPPRGNLALQTGTSGSVLSDVEPAVESRYFPGFFQGKSIGHACPNKKPQFATTGVWALLLRRQNGRVRSVAPSRFSALRRHKYSQACADFCPI